LILPHAHAAVAYIQVFTVAAMISGPGFAAPRRENVTPQRLAAIAPSAAPPFLHLLAHYGTRPPWPVAGVDLAVGTPSGTILKDPAKLDMPGVTVDASRHLISITGDHVVLDGFDFRLAGGRGVLTRGNDTRITRCSFKVGANDRIPITASREASGLTIRQTTIDGGGVGVVRGADAIFALVDAEGSDLTIEENWMRLAPVDAIDVNGGGTLVVRNNFFNHLGYAASAHADSVQFTRGTVHHANITRNTVYDPQPVDGFAVLGGEGLQVETQLGGWISDVQVTQKAIITTGPLKVAGYFIAIRPDSGSRLDGLLAADNYLDPNGGWGGFYPPLAENLHFRHNVDMRSGSVMLEPVPAANGR
jgi:hypothetical protein